VNWNFFNLFKPKSEISYEQLVLLRLAEIQDAQSKFFANLANLVSSAIKKYICIICGSEYARLPGQSEKRCPACQKSIKEVSGLSAGNATHRSNGHNTRGIHKKTGPTL
jgi:hypothetical protein